MDSDKSIETRPDGDYDNKDGTWTLVRRFRLRPRTDHPERSAKQSAMDSADGGEESACRAPALDAAPVATSAADCKAKVPLYCPFHGADVMKQQVKDLLAKNGVTPGVLSVEKEKDGSFTLSVKALSSNHDALKTALGEFLSNPDIVPFGKPSLPKKGSNELSFKLKSGYGKSDPYGQFKEEVEALFAEAAEEDSIVDLDDLTDLAAEMDKFESDPDDGGANLKEAYDKAMGKKEYYGIDDPEMLKVLASELASSLDEAQQASKAKAGEIGAATKAVWGVDAPPYGFPGFDEMASAEYAENEAKESFEGQKAQFDSAIAAGDLDAAKGRLHAMVSAIEEYQKSAEKTAQLVDAVKDTLKTAADKGLDWSLAEHTYGKTPEQKKKMWEKKGVKLSEAFKDAYELASKKESWLKKYVAVKDAVKAGASVPDAINAAEAAESADAAGKPAPGLSEPKDFALGIDLSKVPAASKLQPLAHDESAFPASVTLDQLKQGHNLIGGSGSVGMALYRCVIGGKTYAAKIAPASQKDFLENEMAFDMAYRAAGILAPDHKKYEVGGYTVKLAEWIDGKQLGSCSAAERAKAKKELLKGYALDALFSNWDVLGQGLSNVIVDKEGRCWRIDNGSAGNYDAHGHEKAQKSEYMKEFHEGHSLKNPKTVAYEPWSEWGDRQWPDDWRTMRRASVNQGMFDFTTHEIFSAASRLDFHNVLKSLPEETRKMLAKPAAEMREMANHAAGADLAGYRMGTSYSWKDADGNSQSVSIDPVSTALDALYDSAKAGCREFLKGTTGWANLAWLGSGSSKKTAYSPIPYESVKPKPLPPQTPNEGEDFAQTVFKAVKSVNYHIDQGDYAPNSGSLNAMQSAKTTLELRAKDGSEKAKKLLGIIAKVEESAKGGYKQKIVNPDASSGFYDFGALKTVANEKEIAAAKAKLATEFEKYQKELAVWEKEKSAHDKKELSKAKKSGAAPAQNFQEWIDGLVQSNNNTDGIAQGGGDNACNQASKSGQKHTSWSLNSCKKKVRQYAMMGIPLDKMKFKSNDPVFYNGHTKNGGTHVSGGGTGTKQFYEAIDWYSSHPQQFKKDMEAYARHKGMMAMCLFNMTNPSIDRNTGTVWVMRGEHKEAWGKGGSGAPTETGIIKPYQIDCSPSACIEATGHFGGKHIGWKLPMWRVTDNFMVGDGSEQEICINPIRIPHPPMHFASGAGDYIACKALYEKQPEVKAADAKLAKLFL